MARAAKSMSAIDKASSVSSTAVSSTACSHQPAAAGPGYPFSAESQISVHPIHPHRRAPGHAPARQFTAIQKLDFPCVQQLHGCDERNARGSNGSFRPGDKCARASPGAFTIEGSSGRKTSCEANGPEAEGTRTKSGSWNCG